MMDHSHASNDGLASTTTTLVADNNNNNNNNAVGRSTQVESMQPSAVQATRCVLPATSSRSMRGDGSRVASMRCSTAGSEHQVTSSASRFKMTDASLQQDKFSESSMPRSVASAGSLPPRLGPSFTRRILTHEGSRGDMLRKETSQLLHITEGVRRRVSNVLKYAGIDIDTETDKLKQLWQTFDSDGDGTIDYQEFCKYTLDLLEVDKAENGEAATLTTIETRLIQMVTFESKRCVHACVS